LKKILGANPESRSLAASVMASVGSGIIVTALTFGSQARNAQMAYNQALQQSLEKGRQQLILTKSYKIWGVGAMVLACRNSLTIASVRAMSPWLEQMMPECNTGPIGKSMICDAVASTLTCVVSSPMHQTLNFLVTTPGADQMPFKQRWLLIADFLNRQYFVPKPMSSFARYGLEKPPVKQSYSWMLSSAALRDFGMRAIYIATMFTLFTSIERNVCRLYRTSGSWMPVIKDEEDEIIAYVPMLHQQA